MSWLNSNSNWLINVATSLLKANEDWDLFYMHSHPIDWFYHGWLSAMSSDNPEVSKNAFAMEREIYRI